MRRIGALVLVSAMVLGGCASTSESTEIQASGLSFAYAVEGGKPMGLIRAFDDGQRTVLQFVTDPPPSLKVVDTAGKVLAIERIGQHVALPGLQGQVRVIVDSALPAVVRALDARTPAPGAAPTPSESNAITAARADLWFAESRMAELEGRLGGRKGSKADKAQLDELKVRLHRARKAMDGSLP